MDGMDIFRMDYQLFCTKVIKKEICAYPINEKRENKKLPFQKKRCQNANYFYLASSCNFVLYQPAEDLYYYE